MIKRIIIGVFICLLSSCVGLPQEDYTPKNDNAELYDTEWSTKDYQEGLKFYKDDTVMSFAGGTRSKGTFEYTKSIGFIKLEGLEEYYSTYTAIITGAQMQDDGSMKLYWHKLGEDKGYYEVLYRRR